MAVPWMHGAGTAASERLPADDMPLVQFLSYGVLRYRWRLEWQLGQLLDRPLKKRDHLIEALLLVGLFQLSDSRVPDHAAVSMTVEAARLLRQPKYSGLINAVLRNFVRRKLAGQAPTADEARYDHPEWLIRRIREDWPEDWQEILETNNQQAPMWLRVSARHGDASGYLAETGLEGEVLSGLGQAIRLAEPVGVDSLPGFAAGRVSVQDGAAQLAAPWLLADGGRHLLDACAAPGGKTGHLLELAADADLVAVESDAERAADIGSNLERLGLNATVCVADASNSEEWWDGRPFDRILLDAPCSATGVIRRHPDIKSLRRESDIETLSRLQRRLLERLWPTLAPGGRLLYVTCSVLEAENDAVVESFLEQQSDARERPLLHDYNIRDLMVPKRAGCQVLPGRNDMDGFYFACLEKDGPAE